MMPDNNSDMRRFFPVGLDLNGKRCLIIGGGNVGTRKALTLVQAGANVTVVSLATTAELAEQMLASLAGFEELLEQGTVEERKEFVRAFVQELEIDPDRGRGVLHIRRFPKVGIMGTGERSWVLVPGARFDTDSLTSEELEWEEIDLAEPAMSPA